MFLKRNSIVLFRKFDFSRYSFNFVKLIGRTLVLRQTNCASAEEFRLPFFNAR